MRFLHWLLANCFLLLTLPAFGQQDAYALLQTSDAQLRTDIVATEQTIDLVQAWVSDSVIDKRKQRLKGFGGWIAQHTWARYWLYFTDHKQKYIGTTSRPYHIFDGLADEIDINIFLMPHIDRYIQMVRSGFDLARQRPRGDKGFRFDEPAGYPLPEDLKVDDLGYLTIECEVTPPHAFQDVLGKMFAPTREGDYALDTVPNFGTNHVSFGMTGPWCMDCNHNCRPEIHPIEWFWWRDLGSDHKEGKEAKAWMVSLMVDGSNRFNDWTPSPKTGEIAIPFALPPTASRLDVKLQHIASDPLEMQGLTWPAEAIQSGDTLLQILLPKALRNGKAPACEVQTEGGWPSVGTQYWISGLETVPGGGIIGYFHVATTVKSLLAFRIAFVAAP